MLWRGIVCRLGVEHILSCNWQGSVLLSGYGYGDGAGIGQGRIWSSVEWEFLQVFLCSFIACNVKLCFVWEFFYWGLLILMAFDVLEFDWYRNMADGLVYFICKVVIIDYGLGWVRYLVFLKGIHLLDQA